MKRQVDDADDDVYSSDDKVDGATSFDDQLENDDEDEDLSEDSRSSGDEIKDARSSLLADRKRLTTKTTAAPTANPNSPVEKGTQFEFPNLDGAVSKAKKVTSKPANKEGLVAHSNLAKTKAEKSGGLADKAQSGKTTTTTGKLTKTTTTTGKPKATMNAFAQSKPATTTTGKVVGETDESDEDDEEADEVPAKSEGDSHKKITAVRELPKEKVGNSEEAADSAKFKASLNRILDVSEKLHGGNSANVSNVTQSINKLAEKSKGLEAKRNTSIMLNGRHFDQVRQVECVDEKFFQNFDGRLEPSCA